MPSPITSNAPPTTAPSVARLSRNCRRILAFHRWIGLVFWIFFWEFFVPREGEGIDDFDFGFGFTE
jgi:hypothetical protein